jgi:fucose 4-O-acetylase-like acetyltransferase
VRRKAGQRQRDGGKLCRTGPVEYDAGENERRNLVVQAVNARDVRIDSVKGGLMILVIFGHLIEMFMAKSPLYIAIYSSIYVFHMPLFVITAGMFSKDLLGPRDYRSIFSRLLVPLAICQALYLGWAGFRTGHLNTPPLQPHWILWFLLSMILWKLMLPLVARVRYAMALAILLTLIAGYSPDIGYAFSLSRAFYFFPFFLLGFQYRERILASMSTYRWGKAVVLAIILVGIGRWSYLGLPLGVLYGSQGYDVATVLPQAPLAGRAIMLTISLFASLAALSLMSVRWRFLAYLGQRSLAIFVLHGLFVVAIGKLHLEPSPGLLAGLFVLSVTIAALTAFCDPYLARIYDKIADIFLGRTSAVRQ